VHPLFILDPHFLSPDRVGAARLRFLLESLADLDAGLRKRNSRLIVLHGKRARAQMPVQCTPADVVYPW
jgi:cryptochrome